MSSSSASRKEEKEKTRRPMATCRRVTLFSREIKERVSPAGFALLLESARKISEGRCSGRRYYGSTMLTLDLRTASSGVSEACDVATAQRLARLLEQESELLEPVRQLALADARRIAHQQMARLETEVRIRAEGCRILLDVDLEGEVSLLARGK